MCWGSGFENPLYACGAIFEGGAVPDSFPETLSLSPKTSNIDDKGLFDHLMHFARWHCAIAIANFFPLPSVEALHWYSTRCIHPSQRRISSWPMTDNIFEIETAALAHESTGLLGFLCRFLRRIYRDSITPVEFAGAERGQFLMARGVRQGLSCECFLFLQWPLTQSSNGSKSQFSQRNPDNLEFLQPAQNANADDLAVASLSCRGPMTALAPAFRSVSSIARLSLNYRKCCWVHYGTEEHDSLRTWISENGEEFREMQIVRHAKDVGTMIGPDGHLHRWTAPRTKVIQRVLKINASTKSLVERLCDFKICAISVLFFSRICICTKQGNPQGREPCSSVYHSSPVLRYSIYASRCWLRLWLSVLI